jgi:hypothetical protein
MFEFFFFFGIPTAILMVAGIFYVYTTSPTQKVNRQEKEIERNLSPHPQRGDFMVKIRVVRFASVPITRYPYSVVPF